MKRVRIMLTAITVLAVVGGALAFKAQRFDMQRICYGISTNNCGNWTTESTTAADGGILSYYTTTLGTDCQGAICPTLTHLVEEVD